MKGNAPAVPSRQPFSPLAFLQLVRAPNVFTAISDIAMGVLVVSHTLSPGRDFFLLACSSSALYSAGMVLNDFYDFETDSRLRPGRPLPSGRIGRATAWRLGYGLLSIGILLACFAGLAFSHSSVGVWRSGLIALLLALTIVLYDTVLKRTWLGPLSMGGCRFWNVLLGMSLAAHADGGGPSWLGYDGFHLAIAAGIGGYIVGVTLFARREAEGSSRVSLSIGLAIMLAGVALLAASPRWAAAATRFHLEPSLIWPLVLCMLGVPIVRRCLIAIVDPRPGRVQAAVKVSILSLVVLDAAIALLVSPWYWAAAVLGLLIPTTILGRWVYST